MALLNKLMGNASEVSSEKLNKEALRVINILPTWTAGTMNGTAVDVMYAYTISVGK